MATSSESLAVMSRDFSSASVVAEVWGRRDCLFASVIPTEILHWEGKCHIPPQGCREQKQLGVLSS